MARATQTSRQRDPRDVAGCDRDSTARKENAHERQPSANHDPIFAADVDGTIFDGVVTPTRKLATIARHFEGCFDTALMVLADDGLTLTGLTDDRSMLVDGHLAYKDFAAGMTANTPGIVEVPTDGLADAVRFLEAHAAQLEVIAAEADEQLAVRVDDGDRFAGIDLPTGDDRSTSPPRGFLPSNPLPVHATLPADSGLAELATAHTRSVLEQYEAPIRPDMDLSDREKRRRKAGDVSPTVLVTASAPRADGAAAPTVGGTHDREGAVLTVESTATDVPPVLAGATPQPDTPELAAFEYVPPADDDAVTAEAERLPVFESEAVERAHAGNEVLAQTAVSAPKLKRLFAKPTKRQLAAPHEVWLGMTYPLKVKRSFDGGGFVRTYIAPPTVIP